MRLRPMVLISDLRLPKRNGIVLITQLKSLLPALGVMIHTGCENGVMLGMACDAHPAGVVHSEDGVNGLRKGFEAAISGERYVSKAVMERITRQGGERCKLTPTELIVLMKVVGGSQTRKSLCDWEYRSGRLARTARASTRNSGRMIRLLC